MRSLGRGWDMWTEAGNRRVPSDASTICQYGLQESFSKDPRRCESDPRDHSQLREVRLRVGGLAQTLGAVGRRHSRMEPDVVEARRQAVHPKVDQKRVDERPGD